MKSAALGRHISGIDGSRRRSRGRIHQTSGELSAHLKENTPRQSPAPANEDRIARLAHHDSSWGGSSLM